MPGIIHLSKNTINRLVKDIREIIKNPLDSNGIYYKHHEEDLLKGYALIIGPENTPYAYGNYLFEFSYPIDYPHSPPIVKYLTNDGTTRFNPNLYRGGKVCVSVLNTWRGEGWSACQSISSILLTLCSLLNNEPLLNEPGITKHNRDYKNYNNIIKFKNFEVAIIKMLNKNVGVYSTQLDCLYEIMVDNFNKNHKNILTELTDERKLWGEPGKSGNIITAIYNMNIWVDYEKLHLELSELAETLKVE